MSVSVEYQGKFGNWLFQYSCARLFALDNSLSLLAQLPDQSLLEEIELSNGWPGFGEPTILTDSDSNLFSRKWPSGNYLLKGYFQRAEWYVPRRETIRSFFKLPEIVPNSDDLVMHLRLGDYKDEGWVISPEWYVDIIKNASFKRLYIVGNYDMTAEFDKAYLANFSAFDPIVMPVTSDNFFDLMKFRKVIFSNSSFCFWAGLLGNAEKPYIFKRWAGHSDPAVLPVNWDGAVLLDGQLIPCKE